MRRVFIGCSGPGSLCAGEDNLPSALGLGCGAALLGGVPSVAGGGGGWGVGYYVDGSPASSSQFGALFGMGAAVLCPNCPPGARAVQGAGGTTVIEQWILEGAMVTIDGQTYRGEITGGHWEPILKVTGDFSAGAGDVLSLSGTYWVRRWMGTESVVNEKSVAYVAGAATGTAIGIAIGGTGGAVAEGKYGQLFGRGNPGQGIGRGMFNRGAVRFGWAWEGSATAGRDVIRLGIGAARGTSWWSHIPFLYP